MRGRKRRRKWKVLRHCHSLAPSGEHAGRDGRWKRGEREEERGWGASQGILKVDYDQDKKRFKQVGPRGPFLPYQSKTNTSFRLVCMDKKPPNAPKLTTRLVFPVSVSPRTVIFTVSGAVAATLG